MVVGGVAVVLHGHLRTTMDLDLVIELEPENVRQTLEALSGLGFQPIVPVPMTAFADPAIRDSWIRERNMVVFSLWHPSKPTLKIDIFVSEPFDFDAAYERSVRVDLGRTEATVVAVDDLIALKREAGRPQDLADVESLSRLLQSRDGAGDGYE